jgi:hypothetical protein
VQLFAPDVRYEDRASEAIQEASKNWRNIDDVVLAIEWAIIHDHQVGRLINERGIRGFEFPGARSIGEPDVDVLYELENLNRIIIHDLTFRDAKARYAGQA